MKHTNELMSMLWIVVAPRRGAWIETQSAPATNQNHTSRTPQGCVDRNVLATSLTPKKPKVAPRRAAWIETLLCL